jgi:hypothetical protein
LLRSFALLGETRAVADAQGRCDVVGRRAPAHEMGTNLCLQGFFLEVIEGRRMGGRAYPVG